MNKKMKELLVQIQEKTKAARSFMDNKEKEKAQAELDAIAGLQREYEQEKALFELEKGNVPDSPPTKIGGQMSEEEKAFVGFCRGTEKDLKFGSNGAIVPKTIANRIIEKVKELSPIYSRATIYNVNGTLSIPVYGADGSSDISAAYGTEFTDLTASAGKFTSVDLNAIMVGSLAKISKMLINNTDIDVLSFIVEKVGKAIAEFLEKELLAGTGATGHMTGATKTTNTMELTASTLATITADVLIDAQLTIPEVYQANACWIMHKDVFKAVRKFKDSNGDYLMTRDFAQGFGWILLGKPVYISENMPAVAAGAIPVLYGDFSGMAVKLSQAVEIQVLNELYAPQHAVGVVGWVEVDSKIENSQKFMGIKMKAGS